MLEKDEHELERLQKTLRFSCRVHPTEWWHEVGCDCYGQEWTKEDLLLALFRKKEFEEKKFNEWKNDKDNN